MIELTWGHIRSKEFKSGWDRVISYPHDFKLSYHLSRIHKVIFSQFKDSEIEFSKLVRKYAPIAPDGKFQIPEEKLESYQKELLEFMDLKFSIEKDKISVEQLKEVKLSPLELTALEPLLSGLEALEGGQNG